MLLKPDCFPYVRKRLFCAARAGNNQGSRAPKEPVAQRLIDFDALHLAQQHLIRASGNETVVDHDPLVGDDEVGKEIL